MKQPITAGKIVSLWILVGSIQIPFPAESFINSPLPTTTSQKRRNGPLLPLQAELIFNCECIVDSDPLPGTALKKQEVESFFRKESTRNIFVSAGGTRPVSEEVLTPQLKSVWEDLCNQEYGAEALPKEGDCLLVCDQTTQYPGLARTSTLASGVKLLKGEDGSPQYQFLLVAEKEKVSGIAPIVWIYRQLTGTAQNNDNGEFQKPQGFAETIVSIVEDSQTGQLKFNINAKIRIEVQFPSLMLKILPVSKEKAEEQGSTAISSVASKDLDLAMKGVMDAFRSWKM